MIVTISTSEARVGETVSVDVKANAKEVAALKYHFSYDPAALECTNVEVKGFVANMDENAAVAKADLGEIWLTALALDPVTADEEVIMTLTFKILDAAADVNDISFNYAMVIDKNYNEMTVEVNPGAVGVIRKGDGDINGDNIVNTMDSVLLYAHVSGARTMDEESLKHGDVINVGSIDMMDSVLLYAYVSGARPEL